MSLGLALGLPPPVLLLRERVSSPSIAMAALGELSPPFIMRSASTAAFCASLSVTRRGADVDEAACCVQK